jgi:hypothetical protein
VLSIEITGSVQPIFLIVFSISFIFTITSPIPSTPASGGAEAAAMHKKLQKALDENETLRKDNEAKAEEIKQLKVAIEELR